MAIEELNVTEAASRVRARRLLPFVLAIPIVAISVAAYLVASEGSRGGRLPLAPGAVGGLHPIAGEFVVDETELSECGSDAACLEQAFGNIAYRAGPTEALVLFERRLEADPAVERGCHRIVHFIGAAALERLDGNVAKTFSQGSPVCVSGYYHGILERAFLGVSTKAGLLAKARSLCDAGGLRRRGFLDYQCRHGLGHGLMIQTGYDLLLALEVCAGLGSGWDHKACAGGAFMENINTRFGYRSPWLDDVDPLYPCGRVAARDQRSCYLRASWRILTLEKGSFQRTAEICSRLGRWATTCLHGYGRDVAEKARGAPGEIGPLCRLAGPSQGDCLFGAARTVANASGRAGVEPARRLCSRVPTRHRAECFAGVGLVIGMLEATTASRRAACLRLTHRYAESCLESAENEIDPSGARSWG